MTTFTELSNMVRQQLDSFGLVDGAITYLTQPLSPSATSMSLATPQTGNIPAGIVEIGNEQIYITHHDKNNAGGDNTTILVGGREWNGTEKAADEVPAGTLVRIAPMWTGQQIKTALESTVSRVYPTLFGVKQFVFNFEATKWQYEVPPEAERVLNVRTQLNAAHNPWVELNRWYFSPVSDPLMGNSLTLDEYPMPGQPCVVSYATVPVLDPDSGVDVWEQTGLRPSFLQGLLFGAVAFMLSFQDAGRSQLRTTALNTGSENPEQRLGTVSGLAANLEQRFQAELLAEKKRQNQTWPAVVNFTRNR